MSFYDKYLRGIDAGKVWGAVAVPTIALFNGLLYYKIPQWLAFAICAIYVLFALVQTLVIPKTPQALAKDPTVQEAVVSVASPLLMAQLNRLSPDDEPTALEPEPATTEAANAVPAPDPDAEALKAIAVRMGLAHLLKDATSGQ